MNKKTFFQSNFWILALVLFGLGVGGSGWFLGNGILKFKGSDRHITVKGLSEKEVTSELVFWSISFEAAHDDLEEARRKIEEDYQTILVFLKEEKLEKESLEIQYFYITDRFAQGYLTKDNLTTRYLISKTLLLRSSDVSGVKKASQNLGGLFSKGVNLSGVNTPTFIFSGLNEIKPAMISEATKMARKSAEQFALDSGSQVGKIRTANQGIFQILPVVETYGINVNNEIIKKVRLVSTITYDLND